MKTFTITRILSDDQWVDGIGQVDGLGAFCTGEDPDLNNQPGISCVLPGEYLCRRIKTPKHPKDPNDSTAWDYEGVYALEDKNGRTAVELHRGNFHGNKALGYRSDVEGCILLGNSKGDLDGQRCVLDSDAACKRFYQFMNGEDFLLTIEEKYQ